MQDVQKRDFGIDILKITSMFLVVLLHNLGQGGLFFNLELSSTNSVSIWILQNFARIAVNVFAIVSGYLLVSHSPKNVRVLELFIQMLFWALIVFVILKAIGYPVTVRDLVSNILSYWYVYAYLAVVLFAPFVNEGLRKLPQQISRNLLLANFLVCVSIGFIGKFFLLNGFSGYWLLVLYSIGGYFKLYYSQNRLKKWFLVALVVVMISFSFFA